MLQAGRAEPMSQSKTQTQSAAQAGSPGQAAGVGSSVGGVRITSPIRYSTQNDPEREFGTIGLYTIGRNDSFIPIKPKISLLL